MQRCWVLFGFAVLCFLIQDGSGQTDQTDRRLRYRERQRRRLAELSRATSSFGLTLYRRLASRDDNNVIFSPFSVFTALSMTLLGTNGRTKEELRSVMSQRPRQGVHRALRAIMDSFPSSPVANVTLRVANTLYYDRRQISLNDGFSRSVRRLYGAYPQEMQRPEPEGPINDWIFRQTGGKISDFFSPGEITQDMVLILLNAVYFQGTWRDIFDKRSTYEQDFTMASGRVVRVPMMTRDGDYSVKSLAPDLRASVLELPFGTDDRFSLFIVLPDQPNGLPNLEARLTSEDLEEALSNMPQARRFMILVPKFTLRVKTSMKDVLQSMGLTNIFSDRADLSRMVTDARLKVADVKHEAVIEVDEKGATAAAVTVVEMVSRRFPPSFRADHPFLLVLRDNKARLNLFMGRLNHPSQQE